MLSLGFILGTLREHIIRLQIKEEHAVIEEIAFVQAGAQSHATTLLLCERDLLPRLLQDSCPAPGSTILVAGNNEEIALPNAAPVNLILTGLSALELYHKCADALASTKRWEVHFLETMLTHSDAQSVLSSASALTGADVLYLSPELRTIETSITGRRDDPLLDQARTGRLEESFLQTLVEKPYYGLSRLPGFTRALSSHTKHLYYRYDITGNEEVLASIYLITDPDSGHDIQSLTTLMGRCLKKTLQSGRAQQYHKDGELHKLFCNIMEGTISVPEIKRQLKLAPHAVRNFCSIGIVEFEGRLPGSVPFGHVMRQLAEVFPETNMLVYESCIVLFISFDERQMRIRFDGARLAAILEQHDAYISMSNASRNRAMLRTLYLLAKSTLRLAKVLRIDLHERIFLHEDYSMYNIIDLCAQSYQEIHQHDDLIYLIHPSIVEISRRDQNNNNNLLDVLYHYLLNDRNLVKTAKALYMHRNTVINKVNKLTEIIGSDLENGDLQQRLMFSCQFIRYVTVYLEKTILLN